MYKQFLAGVIMLLLSGITARGQYNNVFPASPNMATLQRFGDYPVSYGTGVPQISMPLYTIKQKDFSYPVNIDYHAGGMRGGADFSPLGLGWALTGVASISREIRGRPDEIVSLPFLGISADSLANFSSGFPDDGYTGLIMPYDLLLLQDENIPVTNSQNDYNSDIEGYNTSSVGITDTQYDIFSYTFGPYSGKFIVVNGNAVQLTYSPLQITVSNPSGGYGFTITDEKGNTYLFGVSGSFPNVYGGVETTSYSVNQGALGSISQTVPSAWLLATIGTPSGAINFSYTTTLTHPDSKLWGSYTSYSQDVYGYEPNNLGYDSEVFTDAYGAVEGSHPGTFYSNRDYEISFLTGIHFNQGDIAFSYQDTTWRLQNMVVTNKSSQQIKKVNFTYSEQATGSGAVPNNQGVVLHQFKEQGGTGSPFETTTFKYKPGMGPLGGDHYNQNFSDWWGYYATSDTGIPVDPSDTYPTSGGSKASSYGDKAKAIIDTIIYPTGGITSFAFEDNMYQVSGTNYSGPGIRIHQIISDDGSGTNKVTKTYEYGELESGTPNGVGNLAYIPNPIDFWTEQQEALLSGSGGTLAGMGGTWTLRTYKSFPSDGMTQAYQMPLYYSRVAEKITADDASKDGETVYTFNASYPAGATGTPRVFTYVPWAWGQQLTKDVYKYNGSSYVLMDQSGTGYQAYHQTVTPQILVSRTVDVPYDNSVHNRVDERYYGANGLGPLYSSIYVYTDNPLQGGIMLPSTTYHIAYDLQGNSDVSTATNYNYKNDDWASTSPITTTVITSRGDSLVTDTKHIGDLNSNNLSNVVENSTYRMNAGGGSKRLVSSTMTIWAASGLVPDTVWSVEPTTPINAGSFAEASVSSGHIVKDPSYVRKQVYDLYDTQRNLLEQHAENGPTTCYVWAYSGMYPVAKIENASYSTVQTVLNGTYSGSAPIDTFRNNPYPSDAEVTAFLAALRTSSSLAGAQITTYTYAPLIGMTSMADTKGEKTFYQYDSSNRLARVMDHNYNVVKVYCYNYTGQSGGCPVTPNIYARLETGNSQLVQEDVDSTSNPGIIKTTDYFCEDGYIRFYYDAACTVPATLATGLIVTFQTADVFSNDYGSTTFHGGASYTVSAGVNSVRVFSATDPAGSPSNWNDMIYYYDTSTFMTDINTYYLFHNMTPNGNSYIPEAEQGY